MSIMVCYCFEYTAEDIARDVRRHDGESLILARIMEQKQKGACQCATKNPKGTWCAGEVRQVVDVTRRTMAAERARLSEVG